MKRFITGICIIALLPCLAWAAELTGRDIAIKMDAVDTILDAKRTSIMVINRKGQKLVRKMESCKKKYGPDERGLIKDGDEITFPSRRRDLGQVRSLASSLTCSI